MNKPHDLKQKREGTTSLTFQLGRFSQERSCYVPPDNMGEGGNACEILISLPISTPVCLHLCSGSTRDSHPSLVFGGLWVEASASQKEGTNSDFFFFLKDICTYIFLGRILYILDHKC